MLIYDTRFSDAMYDLMFEELKRIEEQYPLCVFVSKTGEMFRLDKTLEIPEAYSYRLEVTDMVIKFVIEGDKKIVYYSVVELGGE